MKTSRRNFFKTCLTFLVGLKTGRLLAASDKLLQAIQQEIGKVQISASNRIKLTIPQIAEEGAFVPIVVESTLDPVEAIFIFAENNPTPLIAKIKLDSSLEAYVSLQIKLNESGEVLALLQSESQYYSASQSVKVVIGGCN